MTGVLVITGPTATGKTAMGAALAGILDGEVVSADSMQVYRRMDIGTAKPSPEEMGGAVHHMIDVADPDEPFSAARYVECAVPCVEGIISRGKLPIIVGGTGLYIDSLLRQSGFAPRDEELRGELARRYEAEGGERLHAELEAADPVRAAKIPPADKKRLLRALEIFILTGRKPTELDEETNLAPPRWAAVRWALSYKDRDTLYARIGRRVDEMMARGLADEVRSLLCDVPREATSMQAIGYKELAQALGGGISYEDAVENIKRESRRYAKRQLTWLRRRTDVNWILWNNFPDELDFREAVDKIRLSIALPPDKMI